MLIVAGTMTLDPNKLDVAMAAAHKCAAATREESGNQDYVFSVDTSQPGHIRVFEMWDSQEALDAHFATAHMAEFMGATADFGITGTSIMKYQSDDGEKLM